VCTISFAVETFARGTPSTLQRIPREAASWMFPSQAGTPLDQAVVGRAGLRSPIGAKLRATRTNWHPKTERLTIISGTLNLGTGDRFDAAATKALPAGTFSSMPPRMTR